MTETTTPAPDAMNAALSHGERIVLVELFSTDLYVFDDTHEVGGPMLRALSTLGFDPVLPPGVTVPTPGNLRISIDNVLRTDADHVLFMNFSTDEEFVHDIVDRLGAISEDRVYRIDSTVSEAFSDDWREDLLTPRARQAIAESTRPSD